MLPGRTDVAATELQKKEEKIYDSIRRLRCSPEGPTWQPPSYRRRRRVMIPFAVYAHQQQWREPIWVSPTTQERQKQSMIDVLFLVSYLSRADFGHSQEQSTVGAISGRFSFGFRTNNRCRGPDRRTAARLEEGKAYVGIYYRSTTVQRGQDGRHGDPRRLCGQNKEVATKTTANRNRREARSTTRPFVSAE
jgi:hypothetical protein